MRIYNGIDLSLVSKVGGKPIPKGSSVIIQITAGTPAGTELNAIQTPDDGYLFDISYFALTVPDGVEANIIVETSEGEFPLLASNTQSDVLLDASDFRNLDGIRSFTLYAKVLQTPASDISVILEFGGKQVKS